MGPNLFCWQPICNVGHYDIRIGLGNLHPRDLTQLRVFLDKTKLVAHTFSTYIENLRIGVKAGMVRSKEECSAGLKSFKRRYLQVSLQGVKGLARSSPHCRHRIALQRFLKSSGASLLRRLRVGYE